MADDRSGMVSAFAAGLIAGAAIGVGLGLLFAPKSGAALRRDVARRARDLQDAASDQYERASDTAGEWASRGRDAADRAKSAVATGIREARRYANDMADGARGV